MAYNQSTGSLRVGDLLNEDDNDTSIDWDSDKIQFKTDNTVRFVIENNGCGIGTVSPTHTLQIDSNSGVEGLQVNGAANQYVASFRASTTTGQSYGPYVRGGTNSSDAALIVDNAAGTTSLLKLTGEGKLGIGTNSPDGKLHVLASSAGSVTVTGDQANGIIVEDDDSTAITLLDPNSGVIYFGDADDTDIGRIGYRHGGDYANSLYFTTNNSQRMTIDSAGNVGIGVADPDEKLEVSGAIHISAELGGSDIPSTPAANDGGVLYGKEDGKLYYKSNTVAETDLTSGGGGSESPNLVTAGYLKVSGSSTLGDASGDSVTINAATINIANVAAGTDNTVLVYNGSTIVHDEIDSRVWGSTLVDASGTPADDQIAVWTDANTAEGSSNLTFDGNTLTTTNSSNTAIPAIKIDRNYTGTTSIGNLTTDPQGLLVDYDVTGIVASGQTAFHDAIAINFNQDSPTMVGTVNSTGLDCRMTGGTSGAQTMKGIAVRLAGADTNIGLDVEVPDGQDHVMLRSSADTGDYFAISTTTHGATTIKTVDDDAAAADLTFTIDGDINLNPAGGDVKVTGNVSGSGTLQAVGATTLSNTLAVSGTVSVAEKIEHAGDTDTYISFTTDDINFQAGGVNFLDLTEDTQNEVTFNEGGVDVDFRVESVDETHMLFIEGSSNRMSIGDSTDGPAGTLEITNASDGGVPALVINSNDTDKRAVEINAANVDANVLHITADAVTTAKVINISADALTTGNAVKVNDDSSNTGTRQTALIVQNNAAAIAATALHVQSDGGITGVKLDKNFSDTTAATVTGLGIDFDKTGASTSNNTMYGLNIDMDNTTATNGNNYMYGLHVTPTLTHAADAGGAFVYGALINAQGGTNGSSFVQGARIEAGGGDINYGLQLDVEDGGIDLRIESSADSGDYFQIQTTTHGATTITTVDDDATAADLTFTIDGDINLNPAGGDVKVTGDVSGSGNANFVGNVVTAGYLKVSGSSTLGDASGDGVTINAATITVPNLPASTDNTVMVVNSSNEIGTDEINAKVWGTQLIENSGTPLNNQVATWGGATTLGGESNLIFDGSKLQITGRLSASANINSVGYITTAAQLNASGSTTIGGATRVSGSFRASGSIVLGDRASVDTTLYSEDIKLVNVPAGVDNTVLVVDGNGLMRTDEVDGRVWGSTLVDVAGAAKSLQIPIFSDSNTITGSNVVRWVGPQATLAVTGAIRSQGQIHITEHAYNTTATTEKWLPFYTLSEANAPNNATYINQMVVPFGGQLKRVVFRPSGSQHTANPVAKLYKASSPTQLVNANDSGRYVETVSISMAAGPAKVGVFVFTGSAHFSAGDVVGVSIDPAANPVEVNVSCVWEYNVLGV